MFPSKRIYYALGITFLIISICLMPPINNWFKAFVKLESMRIPYIISFFTFLFFLMLEFGAKLSAKTYLTVLLIGCLTGYCISLFSIFVANFFIPNGIERTIKTIDQLGLLNAVAMDFIVSFLIGGWLIGGIAFSAFKYMVNRHG